MKTVALDGMGGDRAPAIEVAGAVAAARTGRVRVLIVGDETRLEPLLHKHRAERLPVEIRHASEVITMHDAPSAAVRRKRDASMRVAVDLVRKGEADAAVSAGNSGAMLACGLFVLGRAKGVDRPAILTTFPTRTGQAALLDMGANVDCRPLNLVQFAVMGACYARTIHGKSCPRVGVLSNGSEEHKGTELTRATHRVLQQSEHRPVGFEYVGYVEGRDVFSGATDVVVCDGFTGNLVLKITEGTAETMVSFLKDAIRSSLLSRIASIGMLPAFLKLKRRMDYAEQGGAPLLGVRGPLIICHGGSNDKAIKNALLGAVHHVREDLTANIQQSTADNAELLDLARLRQVVVAPGDKGSDGAMSGHA